MEGKGCPCLGVTDHGGIPSPVKVRNRERQATTVWATGRVIACSISSRWGAPWVADGRIELEEDPFSGRVFVFRGQRGNLLKLLW